MAIDEREGTLEAVLARLAALEERNAGLERRNERVERELAELKAGPAREVVPAGGRSLVSRRAWLRRAAGAAVATVVAGAALERGTEGAAAHHGAANQVDANVVNAHRVLGIQSGPFAGVLGSTDSPEHGGVTGTNRGEAGDGVYGVGGTRSGRTGSGVRGVNAGYGPGVRGENPNRVGPGVVGEGNNGVVGRSLERGLAGVRGAHSRDGYGVYGSAVTANGAGVLGVNGGAGPGVSGESANGDGDGVSGQGRVGVRGYSPVAGGVGVVGDGFDGYGALLRGAKAQVRLVPGATAGKPTSGRHARGELYLDSRGLLYICVAGTTAARPAGTWRRVATVSA